jgi:DNA-binding MarR family transcriptional regulator
LLKSAKRPTLELENYVPGLLSWLHNKYASDGSEVYRRVFGIGMAEWNVLAYLGVFTTGTGAAMSRFLGLDKAAISRAITKLKEKKLAETSHIDKRTIEVSLTALGKEWYEKVTILAKAREQVLLKGLKEEERELALALLHKMLGNLSEVYEFGENYSKEDAFGTTSKRGKPRR